MQYPLISALCTPDASRAAHSVTAAPCDLGLSLAATTTRAARTRTRVSLHPYIATERVLEATGVDRTPPVGSADASALDSPTQNAARTLDPGHRRRHEEGPVRQNSGRLCGDGSPVANTWDGVANETMPTSGWHVASSRSCPPAMRLASDNKGSPPVFDPFPGASSRRSPERSTPWSYLPGVSSRFCSGHTENRRGGPGHGLEGRPWSAHLRARRWFPEQRNDACVRPVATAYLRFS
jgi:hypothetical protein